MARESEKLICGKECRECWSWKRIRRRRLNKDLKAKCVKRKRRKEIWHSEVRWRRRCGSPRGLCLTFLFSPGMKTERECRKLKMNTDRKKGSQSLFCNLSLCGSSKSQGTSLFIYTSLGRTPISALRSNHTCFEFKVQLTRKRCFIRCRDIKKKFFFLFASQLDFSSLPK